LNRQHEILPSGDGDQIMRQHRGGYEGAARGLASIAALQAVTELTSIIESPRPDTAIGVGDDAEGAANGDRNDPLEAGHDYGTRMWPRISSAEAKFGFVTEGLHATVPQEGQAMCTPPAIAIAPSTPGTITGLREQEAATREMHVSVAASPDCPAKLSLQACTRRSAVIARLCVNPAATALTRSRPTTGTGIVAQAVSLASTRHVSIAARLT
jgi:hypothetical protein